MGARRGRATRATLTPGPDQSHGGAEHFRSWARRRGYWFCRVSDVREIMRPVPLLGEGEDQVWGLCDANHRESHEFLPA